jgi:hypothetical protein
VPQRDSCASALAPRLSPKARGLSKTRLQAFPTPVAAAAVTHMHEHVVAYRPARCLRTPPIGFIQPCQPARPNTSAGLGLLHEVKPDGFRIFTRSSDVVRRAALGSTAISRADNQLVGCGGASLDFRWNAKFLACAVFGEMQNFPSRR